MSRYRKYNFTNKKKARDLVLRTDFSRPENLPTRKQAIMLKCIDCTCGEGKEVRYCSVTGCPLWPYRRGTVLNGKRVLVEEIKSE